MHDDLRHAARQPFTVWFAGPPPDQELRATEGVAVVDVRGSEVSGLIEGSPSPFLAVLARHPVQHVLLPEPDLEQAFLPYYESDLA